MLGNIKESKYDNTFGDPTYILDIVGKCRV